VSSIEHSSETRLHRPVIVRGLAWRAGRCGGDHGESDHQTGDHVRSLPSAERPSAEHREGQQRARQPPLDGNSLVWHTAGIPIGTVAVGTVLIALVLSLHVKRDDIPNFTDKLGKSFRQ
jgi:hypothetical protein